MSKLFLTNIDLNRNQIINVVIHNSPTPPTGVEGQLYFNTTTGNKRIYYHNGIEWIDISGDITSVIAGAGLTGGGASGEVTLDVNVDNATIEINNDTLRIKDLGVTAAKLGADAVTTVKILNNNVTLAKIAQIGSLTVLGNLGGSTANVQEIAVVTDLGSATSTSLATSLSIKQYIDNTVGGLGNLEGGWSAASGAFPVGSSPVAGTKKGDYWYVTTAGTVGGATFNVGDVIIAKIDNASTSSAADWIQLEVNRDQATTTALGLVILATQTEVNDGTDANKVVTPATLSGRTATETRTGIAEIATQTEVNTGTDDTRIVTPLKLKTFFDNSVGGYAANVGNGTNTSYALTHNLNTRDVIVSVYDNTTYEEVVTDVVLTSTTVVTVSFNVAPATNAYRVVIKK